MGRGTESHWQKVKPQPTFLSFPMQDIGALVWGKNESDCFQTPVDQAGQRHLLKTEGKWINGSLHTAPEGHQPLTQLQKYPANQTAAAKQEDIGRFFSGESKWSQKNDYGRGKSSSILLDSVAGPAK